MPITIRLNFVVLTLLAVTMGVASNNAGCDFPFGPLNCEIPENLDMSGIAGACCDEHDWCIQEHCPKGCKALNSWPGWYPDGFPWDETTPTGPIDGFPCSDPDNDIWDDDDYDFGECYLCQAKVADCIRVDCGWGHDQPGIENCPDAPSECCNENDELDYCGYPQLCAYPESDINNAHKPVYDPCKCKELYPAHVPPYECKCDDSGNGEGDYCDPFCPCEGEDLTCKGRRGKKTCQPEPDPSPSSFPIFSPENSPIRSPESPSHSPEYNSPVGSPEYPDKTLAEQNYGGF